MWTNCGSEFLTFKNSYTNEFNNASLKTIEAELDLQGSKWQNTSLYFFIPFSKEVMIFL